MHSLQCGIPTGSLLRFKNRKTHRFLSARMREVDSLELGDSQQCWILQEIENDRFEIVQMQTGEVLAWPPGRSSLRLEPSRGSVSTIWTLEHAESVNGVAYYWIRPFRDTSLTLCASALSSKVKVSAIDQTLDICLWELSQCSDHLMKGLSVIRLAGTKMALEVSDSSIKEGACIGQGNLRGCGNQRWIIQTYCDQKGTRHKEYIIRNYCSGLILTACKLRGGWRLTQECFRCEENQRWKMKAVGERTFLLESVGAKQFYLCSPEKEGTMVGLAQEGKVYWTIQGAYCSTILS